MKNKEACMRLQNGVAVRQGRSKLYLLALLPFFILIVMFELLPVVTVIVRSFMPEGSVGFTLSHYLSIFTKKLYQTAILNSVWISLLSSFIGLVIAFFGAKAAHNAGIRGKRTFLSILNMCSNFSGVPLAFSSIILLGNVGVLVLFGKQIGFAPLAEFPLYSVWGLLLTYVYFQIPLGTMLLIPSFDSIKKEWKESVAMLGGNGFQFWIKVGLPVLLPSFLGTFSVLFANALAAYATAYALTMNNVSLLPIRISEQFVGDVVQRQEFGSALAVVMMLLMVVAILINSYVLKKTRKGALR